MLYSPKTYCMLRSLRESHSYPFCVWDSYHFWIALWLSQLSQTAQSSHSFLTADLSWPFLVLHFCQRGHYFFFLFINKFIDVISGVQNISHVECIDFNEYAHMHRFMKPLLESRYRQIQHLQNFPPAFVLFLFLFFFYYLINFITFIGVQ